MAELKKISIIKVITVIIVLILSLLTFKLNDSLRVPSIFDGKFYTTIPIPNAEHPLELKKQLTVMPELKLWADSATYSRYLYTDIMLQNSNTTSFLVLKNGKIIFERYLNGVKEGDVTQVFSVTKVFLTALLGIAINENIIENEFVPVSSLITELKGTTFDKVTLHDLTQMRSGISYDEYKNLLQTIRFYYNTDLKSTFKNVHFSFKPGEKYVYKSIDTQILGECLSRALGEKNCLNYLYKKIWQPLGMQDPAYFTVDNKLSRVPKYYGGLNISARDLAKFGVMVAQNGRYNGKRILPKDWFNQCDVEDFRSDKEDGYCLGWYYRVDDADNDIYFAAGFNGQTMMINETKNVIVIRLGIDKGNMDWYPMMKKLSELV